MNQPSVKFNIYHARKYQRNIRNVGGEYVQDTVDNMELTKKFLASLTILVS